MKKFAIPRPERLGSIVIIDKNGDRCAVGHLMRHLAPEVEFDPVFDSTDCCDTLSKLGFATFREIEHLADTNDSLGSNEERIANLLHFCERHGIEVTA
jgi:hypothetical protein